MDFEHEAPAKAGHPGPGTSRRSVMARAFGVGAVVIGSQLLPVDALVSPAGAVAAPEEADDATRAGFNQGLLAAAASIYRRATDSGKITDARAKAALTRFAAHHQEWAGVLGKVAGDKAQGRPNPVLAQTAGGQIDSASDEKGVLGVLFDVENAVAATVTAAFDAFTKPDSRGAVTPVIPVIGQHAAFLGAVLKKEPSDKQWLPPFQLKDGALDMKKYGEG